MLDRFAVSRLDVGQFTCHTNALGHGNAARGRAVLSPAVPVRTLRINILGDDLGVTWVGLLSLAWGLQPPCGLERWLALLLPTLTYFLARRHAFWRTTVFGWRMPVVFLIFV
jgi:hypothetical protein